MFVINIGLTFEINKLFSNPKSSLLSILHFFILLILVLLGHLEIQEFLLASIIGESVATSLAILYFFIFKKGIDGKSAWKSFGAFTVILISIFFIGTIYPFFGEWILFIQSSDPGILMWIAFATTLTIGIMRKANTLGAIMLKKKKDPNYDHEKEIQKAMDSKTPMPDESKVMLIGLGLWFVGLGILFGIYAN